MFKTPINFKEKAIDMAEQRAVYAANMGSHKWWLDLRQH